MALWAYTGWDSLGSFAGEVVDPYRTYPRGVAITLVINVLLYVLPILTGLTFSAKSSAWTDGCAFFFFFFFFFFGLPAQAQASGTLRDRAPSSHHCQH